MVFTAGRGLRERKGCVAEVSISAINMQVIATRKTRFPASLDRMIMDVQEILVDELGHNY